MSEVSSPALHLASLSLDREALLDVFSTTENLLIIQDLDGVCMGLVKDPLTRGIQPEYVEATRAFDGHFYVLTNGEHIGKRGVNGIVERAFGDPEFVGNKGLYLPGLAAGGVQWQDRYGKVSHPGVSEAELSFLEAVPQRLRERLSCFFLEREDVIDACQIKRSIEASVLDNRASPTANLNTLYEQLRDRPDIYGELQQTMQQLMDELLQEAANQGMGDSFFVHYAPNLGRDDRGQEILRPVRGDDSGTTDFQFMIRGAIKEAGVLAILNRYYHQRTGTYPLGEDFSVRQAPKDHQALLALVENYFDVREMPVLIGVGDTVNSTVEEIEGKRQVRRGGSDRNFLQLIQDIGKAIAVENLVIYVDSSAGEVKNRKPLKLSSAVESDRTSWEGVQVLEGPGDSSDTEDPLTLNVAFPNGYREYTAFFQKAARQRRENLG